MKNPSKRPAIARIWRGRTAPGRADEYEAYNYEAGIKPLIEKAMGVQTFRDDRADETEFLIELPREVQILTIRASHGDIGSEVESA